MLKSFCVFLYTQPENRICFRINAGSVGDRINKIAVMINPTNEPFDCRASYREDVDQTVFRGWQVYVDGKRAGNRPLYPIMGDTVTVPPLSAIVMMK